MENHKNLNRYDGNLPELSDSNFKIVGYIFASLITVAGVYLIYKIIVTDVLTFSANWNMFDSILMWPLYIIGLIVMFANWNKFSFGQDTYIKTTYSDGTSKTEKSYDITDVLFGRVMLPILGRFVIVPIIVAAIIYYPLMCVVHVVGWAFPYIVSLLALGVISVSWVLPNKLQMNGRSIILLLFTIIFTAAFGYGGYALGDNKTDWNTSTSDQKNGSQEIDLSGFEEANPSLSEIDMSEFE